MTRDLTRPEDLALVSPRLEAALAEARAARETALAGAFARTRLPAVAPGPGLMTARLRPRTPGAPVRGGTDA